MEQMKCPYIKTKGINFHGNNEQIIRDDRGRKNYGRKSIKNELVQNVFLRERKKKIIQAEKKYQKQPI